MQHITNITNDELEQCLQQKNAIVITKSNRRPKVIETVDQQIIKIFYPKRKWYYFLTRPQHPGLAFVHNSQRLLKLGIKAPAISKVLYCQAKDVYLVCYPKVQGENFNHAIGKENHLDLIADMALFIAKLHEKGIFFRAIHVENILYQPNENFTLIDVSDVKFKANKLSALTRYRNLKHFMTYRKSVAYWSQERINIFIENYIQKAKFTIFEKMYFMKRMDYVMKQL